MLPACKRVQCVHAMDGDGVMVGVQRALSVELVCDYGITLGVGGQPYEPLTTTADILSRLEVCPLEALSCVACMEGQSRRRRFRIELDLSVA